MIWILIIIIGGVEIKSTCDLSLCFETFEKCFIHMQRVSNSPDISAKCVMND